MPPHSKNPSELGLLGVGSPRLLPSASVGGTSAKLSVMMGKSLKRNSPSEANQVPFEKESLKDLHGPSSPSCPQGVHHFVVKTADGSLRWQMIGSGARCLTESFGGQDVHLKA